MSEGKDAFLNIPLPNEMPVRTTEFSPTGEGFSHTVNSLISQNEDLMNRLSIVLKRNAELEKRVDNYQDFNSKLTQKNEVLEDELELFGAKFKKAEDELFHARERASLSESQYSEYYSESVDKIERLEFENSSYKKSLSRYRRFRRRVLSWGKSYVQSLKKIISDLKESRRVLEIENFETLDENRRLKDDLLNIQQQYSELQELGEKDRRQLVDNYEARVDELADMMTSTEGQLNHYKERTQALESEIESVSEKLVVKENQFIREERKRTEVENRYFEDRRRLELELTEVKGTYEALMSDCREYKTEISNLRNELNEVKQSLDEMTSKRDGLEIIWQENAKTIENYRNQQESADRLNTDLSEQLMEQRRENERLMSEFVEQKSEFDKKLRSLTEKLNINASSDTTQKNVDFQLQESDFI